MFDFDLIAEFGWFQAEYWLAHWGSAVVTPKCGSVAFNESLLPRLEFSLFSLIVMSLAQKLNCYKSILSSELNYPSTSVSNGF